MFLIRNHLLRRALFQKSSFTNVNYPCTITETRRQFSWNSSMKNATTPSVSILGHKKNSTMTTNRLVHAKSPYLLQHANNPVDWYEWGTEAFDKAKRENKPIFLSVGYSACHWCHVLAHESFDDDITAKLMNENFVNIKVDREERPDVDRLYMTFLQATSGRGGWPMSVWLTPDLYPFFAGTYFPKGQFGQILDRLAELWMDEPERCVAIGTQVISALQASSNIAASSLAPQIHDLETKVFKRLSETYDEEFGGFGSAPKFPSPSQTMHFLARYAALRPDKVGDRAKEMAVTTMTNIYNGGIHDVVGDGFARYSVDRRWHVPHFEKMLYDQAQLLTSALELSLLVPPTSQDFKTLQAMARSILTYVSRDLRSSGGAFYSAEDADSLPGKGSTVKKEGAFYVWTAADIDRILGERCDLFNHYFGVEEDGNCDPSHDIQGELRGQNVLYIAHTIEETAKQFGRAHEETRTALAQSLAQLKQYRDQERPRPHLDDKIVASWNGLMITGLSKATEFLEEHTGAPTRAEALALAEKAVDFVKTNLYESASGQLHRSYREGPGPQGQTDDYAFLIQGLLDLYEASGKEEYAIWAIQLQEKQDELFYDKENGGYFSSAPDKHILVRLKDSQDGAEPSATSVTLSNLCRLAHLAENRHTDYTAKAESILHSSSQLLVEIPQALATMVSGAMMNEQGMRQFIVTGEPRDAQTNAFIAKIRSNFIPNRVLLHVAPSNPPNELAKYNGTLEALIRRIQTEETKPNVRICEHFACGPPIYDAESFVLSS